MWLRLRNCSVPKRRPARNDRRERRPSVKKEKNLLSEAAKRGALSFAISSFSGLVINLVIDAVANMRGSTGFCCISPTFRAFFPTEALAAYVNILLYGFIGATFAVTTIIYEYERIGFVIQSIIFFLVTGTVCMLVTMLIWQLWRYLPALISTLCGYAVSHAIVITVAYFKLRKDINEINSELEQ